MTEYFTDALVLDQEMSGEFDKIVYLYTKDFGKIAARAKSLRKITSKLAGHLEPLNFVKVRLVEKNGFQIVDALATVKFKKTTANLEACHFIKEMTFELQPDKKLWLVIKKNFKDFKGVKFSYKSLLEVLGFSSTFAKCQICNKKSIAYFLIPDTVFLCRSCANNSKINKNELIYIY